jgi:hypothetical protein
LQDRYAADIGDYAKFGLLRALAVTTKISDPLKLAVIWYLMPDETHNSDGRHTQFLRDAQLRACDPELHGALVKILNEGTRNTTQLAACGILPPDYTTYYTETIPCANNGRLAPDARKRWFSGALRSSQNADLVFLDPDNGLAGSSVSYSSARAGKYAFLEELGAFTERSQSVLLYQHHHRQSSTQKQITDMLERLRPYGAPNTRVFSFTFRRGSVRTFYLIPAQTHVGVLGHNIARLRDSLWCSFISVSEL